MFGGEADFGPACWKMAYGRGVGKAISACREGEERRGALCYPLCRDGYVGRGPVCWQRCPHDWRNDGAYCKKPRSYGRGTGHFKKKNCEKKKGKDNCEKWGALWYPKCRENFHNAACCICSPDCPHRMIDIGISCNKHSYGRTAGKPMICKPNQEEQAALCYKPCSDDFNGAGPVCWLKCPEGMHKCGALCLGPEQQCSAFILQEAGVVMKTISSFASGNGVSGLISIANFLKDMKYPICPGTVPDFSATEH